jgi:hypothetical protein
MADDADERACQAEREMQLDDHLGVSVALLSRSDQPHARCQKAAGSRRRAEGSDRSAWPCRCQVGLPSARRSVRCRTSGTSKATAGLAYCCRQCEQTAILKSNVAVCHRCGRARTLHDPTFAAEMKAALLLRRGTEDFSSGSDVKLW